MSFIAFWSAPLGNLFPRPGRSRTAGELKTRVSTCLPKQTRKKPDVFSNKIHLQTVIFRQGNPIRISLTRGFQKREKQKSTLSASFFLNFLRIRGFLIFFSLQFCPFSRLFLGAEAHFFFVFFVGGGDLSFGCGKG